MGSKRIPRTCLHCGSDFLAQASDVRRGLGNCCSRKCAAIRRDAAKPRKIKTCQHCGVVITKSNAKYCSAECTKAGRSKPNEARFWAKVDKAPGRGPQGECWQWTAGSDPGDYGNFPARFGGKWKNVLAHRFSYALHYGPFPDALCVLHRCDNPPCVRPDHLFLGTNGDNSRDRHEKGRDGDHKGERNGRARLTADDVREIRRRHAAGETATALSKAYRVGQATISLMVNRKTWAHVT